MSRNRIVINLDEKSAAKRRTSGTKKRGWGRVLGVFVLLLVIGFVLLAVGGFFWWENYKTTPAYSLAVMVDAAQRNDTATVGQMLNTPKIVTSLMGEVTEKATGRYGVTLDPATKQQIETTISGLGPSVQQTIQQELSKSIADLAQRVERRSFPITAVMLPYVVKITSEGELAQASFATDSGTTNLTLAKNGERWQVVGMKDDAIIQRLVDKLMLSLPTIGQPPGASSVRQSNPGRAPSSRRRRR